MQTKRRSEEDELKVEESVKTSIESSTDDYRLDDLLARVEAKHEDDETPVVEADSGAHVIGSGDDDATVDEVLDKISADAASKLEDTVNADTARLAASSHKLVASKVRKSSKQYNGYVGFCGGAIVLGAVWLAVGLLTKSAWPIPFFGIWNEVCGGFLVMWGGLMLLDAR